MVIKSDMILEAALAGLGLAYLFQNQVEIHVAERRLVSLLADWCPIRLPFVLPQQPPAAPLSVC